ncbi:hypothetical protein ACLKA7_012642 [Drosophila subpalustris]
MGQRACILASIYQRAKADVATLTRATTKLPPHGLWQQQEQQQQQRLAFLFTSPFSIYMPSPPEVVCYCAVTGPVPSICSSLPARLLFSGATWHCSASLTMAVHQISIVRGYCS